MSAFRVALITGGASGMGLAVAEGLLARKGWHVYLLDRNAKAFENLDPEVKAATNFRNVHVADYDSLAAVFKDIYISKGRINFVFANAGIGGALDFYETKDGIDPPPKPDTSAIDVNLNGVCYTTYLAAHYFKLQKLEDASVVITASDAALYPTVFAPLYTAAKHGLIGFLRAISPVMITHKIRVNVICPGVVPTPILPPELLKIWPEEIRTPVSTVVNAVLALVDGRDMTDAVGTKVSADKLYGQTVELSVDKMYFRSQPDYCDEACKRAAAAVNSFTGATSL
ncbi:hypothetical protein COCVIDRAFT_32150 [Bipolaris victoriae FI3]|uniref:NAD(P)-binding protein n=1 Tax=Bipolaris victoriae (strain FI3) TaxID=930091 RepID=W7E345_BIPV3|nr:hypothetical protein COCVIDRAFT_32150 [Bipolaris victoriae FI3]